MRFLIAIGLAIGLLGWVYPASAETIVIQNSRGEKVKFCSYRSNDESLIRPRQCWMLKIGQRIRWNRGHDEFPIDVRIFEPGAFELPICFKQNISDSYRIEIAPPRADACVRGHKRTIVPPQNWSPGAQVLVNRLDDNYWYPATILNLEGERFRVLFADRRVATIDPKFIADLVLGPAIPLEVNWKNQGRWYSVRLQSVKNDRVRVIFEDGTEENTSLDLIRIALTE